MIFEVKSNVQGRRAVNIRKAKTCVPVDPVVMTQLPDAKAHHVLVDVCSGICCFFLSWTLTKHMHLCRIVKTSGK